MECCFAALTFEVLLEDIERTRIGAVGIDRRSKFIDKLNV